jgi:hypothetical protein
MSERKVLVDFDPSRTPRYPMPRRPGWVPLPADGDDLAVYLLTLGSNQGTGQWLRFIPHMIARFTACVLPSNCTSGSRTMSTMSSRGNRGCKSCEMS